MAARLPEDAGGTAPGRAQPGQEAGEEAHVPAGASSAVHAGAHQAGLVGERPRAARGRARRAWSWPGSRGSWRSPGSRRAVRRSRRCSGRAATRVITSRSRLVSRSRSTPGGGSAVVVANASMRRRVTLGERSASPAATARTARSSSTGSVSFTRKPLAPARSASNTYSSSSNVVRITTRTAVEVGIVADPAGGVEAVGSGHADVHEHDVGELAAGDRDRFVAVVGLADDLDVVLGVEQRPEARRVPAPGRRRGPPGSPGTARSGSGPGPGTPGVRRAPTSSSPPRAWTRSRMPVRPLPARCSARRSPARRRRPARRSRRVRTPRSTTVCAAPAWRATLVSASWVTRYAAVSTVWGSGRRTPRIRSSTGRPAARRPLDELVDVGERRRRPARRGFDPVTQDVDQRAELVERILARGLDRRQRALGQLGALVDAGGARCRPAH